MEKTEKMIKKQFDTAKKLVEEVLSEDPRARNSDMWLQLLVWQKKQHIKVFIPFEQIGDLIPSETLSRVRRKIQNDEGNYLPTAPDILVKRHIREEFVRRYFSKYPIIMNEWQRRAFGIK